MKVAVLGLGGMGKDAVQRLCSMTEIEEIVGVDVSEARVKALQEQERLKVMTRLDEALGDPAVKLVYVAASNDAHYPLTMAALDAGKAVLCEKPIATTLAHARAMVETAERRGLFFQIGFELRYSKLYTTVKQWVDAGLLGQVINTNCAYICSEFHGKRSWRNRKATGGSMFGEKLSHYVDLPRWWIGSEVVDVMSVCAPTVVPYYEVRDNYHTTYRFANGAVSHLTFIMYVGQTFNGDPLRDVISQQRGDGHELRYLIIGTKGAAETDVFNRSIKRWEFSDASLSMTSRLVERLTWEPSADLDYFHGGENQLKDVVRCVREGLPPMTPARDALETMKVVFAAEESADSGQWVKLIAATR